MLVIFLNLVQELLFEIRARFTILSDYVYEINLLEHAN